MTDVLFYEDSIIFDHDDPDFMTEDHRPDYESNIDSCTTRQSFSADCLPNMSCGLIESSSFSYTPSNGWLIHSESSQSLTGSRLDSMICRVDPEYHGHVNDNSITLEELKCNMNSCNSCGVSWSDNHVSLDCSECGGYSLTRPCPMCDGECEAQWSRDVSMSHSAGKAHWDGKCRLAKEDMPSIPSFLAEDVLIQGLQDLSASS